MYHKILVFFFFHPFKNVKKKVKTIVSSKTGRELDLPTGHSLPVLFQSKAMGSEIEHNTFPKKKKKSSDIYRALIKTKRLIIQTQLLVMSWVLSDIPSQAGPTIIHHKMEVVHLRLRKSKKGRHIQAT